MRRAAMATAAVIAWPWLTWAAFIPENQRNVQTFTFNVSPQGDDAGEGTATRPFRTLARAQQAVRSVNAKLHDAVHHIYVANICGWRGSLADRQHAG